MKVRLTDTAVSDIERIGDALSESDPQLSRLIIRGLRAATRSIGELPHASSPVFSTAGVRKKSVRPYVLLYVIRAGEVLILRVAHERSDWASLV